MSTFEQFISILKSQLRELRLSDAARGKLRGTLAAYADLHTVPESVAAIRATFFERISLALLRTGMAILVLAVGSGTVAYASGNALPGDMLYPVKVRVVEPLETALLVAPETRATWNAILAERRLAEAAALATNDSLDAETRVYLEERFAYHAAQSDTAAEEVDVRGDSEAALAVRSDLEARLAAHADLLLYLSEKDEDSTKLYETVARTRDQIADRREQTELKVATRALGYTDRQLAVAEGVTEEVARRLEAEGVTEEAIESRLIAARDAFSSARSSLAKEERGIAFIASQTATRLTHEASILAKNRSIIALGLPGMPAHSTSAKEPAAEPARTQQPARVQPPSRPTIMLKAPDSTAATLIEDKDAATSSEENADEEADADTKEEDKSSDTNDASQDSKDDDSKSSSSNDDDGPSLRDTVRNTVDTVKSLLGN